MLDIAAPHAVVLARATYTILRPRRAAAAVLRTTPLAAAVLRTTPLAAADLRTALEFNSRRTLVPRHLLAALALVLAWAGPLHGANAGRDSLAMAADSSRATAAGDLTGEVRDRATQQPLAFTSVEIPVLRRAVLAGRDGWFVLERVPPGVYTLLARRIGYAAVDVPDVLVRPGKTTQLVLELERRELHAPAVVVRADPFSHRAAAPVSQQELSYEEVRRSPGAAADISRTVQALPGVTHTSDQTSALIVRGGAPTENLTLLDDVPIPNANHFPEYGGAGGAISMLNVELLRGVSFYTGGFPVQYGDKMSSVLEIKLRDGNRREHSGDLDISMAGAGLLLEGPLAGGKASYLINGRRSYVDLIAARLNTGAVPEYSDLQGKLLWQPNPQNTFTLLGVAGFDRVSLDDDADSYARGFDFVDARQAQYTLGATWKRLLGERGHSLVTVHCSENNFSYDIRDRLRPGAAPDSVYWSDSWEAETGVRARAVLRVAKRTDITWGGEVRWVRWRHFITAFADTAQEALPTAAPDSVQLVAFPRDDVRAHTAATKEALFANVEQRLGEHWTAALGARWDHFDLGGQSDLSPRGGLTWRFDERWTARASLGMAHQTPLAVSLTRTAAARQLPYMRATQAVVGADYRLSHGAQATLEVYEKRYRCLPVPVARGSYDLVPEGTGRVRGLELFVQQRLLDRWYGLVSYSYSQSERTDRIFGTYPDDWDYRHVFTALAGVRPRRGLEFSARWRYIGGRPETQFEQRFEVTPEGALQPGTGYWVGYEGPHNGGRLPAYHRLDLRADHRRQWGRFHLVTFVDLENVYARDNVLTQRYSHEQPDPEPVFQWKLLPVGGISLEF